MHPGSKIDISPIYLLTFYPQDDWITGMLVVNQISSFLCGILLVKKRHVLSNQLGPKLKMPQQLCINRFRCMSCSKKTSLLFIDHGYSLMDGPNIKLSIFNRN